MKKEIEVFVYEKGMEAVLHVPSERSADESRKERLHDAIAKAAVTHGIDRELLDRIEAEIDDPSLFFQEVIARGQPARQPIPGLLITAFSPFLGSGERDSSGRIDFRERHHLITAASGAIIARRYPARPGSPGWDVHGRELEAELPVEESTQLGPGTVIDEQGFIRATRNGVIHHRPGDLIDVVDVFEHHGNVGPHTGNLATGGSLIVHGDIQPGFRIDVGGDASILGDVDQASFRVGGSTAVSRAVIGAENALGRCGLDLDCRRVQGGNLQVAGTLTFDRELVNSTVQARRVESQSPRGTILGSTIKAIESVRIAIIGSSAGSPVQIEVAVDWPLVERIRRLESASVGRGRQRRQESARTRTGRRSGRLEDELTRLKLELRRSQRRLLERAAIEVPGTIHPGVIIKIGGFENTLTEEESRVRFRYDSEAERIITEKLKR